LSAAAIATSIATVTATATATATTATGRTWFARARFINGERPAVERFAINFRNRFLRVLVGAHGHKSEAAGFASEFVLHEHDFLDRASLSKKLL
jgi:hypothetical protein